MQPLPHVSRRDLPRSQGESVILTSATELCHIQQSFSNHHVPKCRFPLSSLGLAQDSEFLVSSLVLLLLVLRPHRGQESATALLFLNSHGLSLLKERWTIHSIFPYSLVSVSPQETEHSPVARGLILFSLSPKHALTSQTHTGAWSLCG